jgi:hypothetical protein
MFPTKIMPKNRGSKIRIAGKYFEGKYYVTVSPKKGEIMRNLLLLPLILVAITL